MKKDGYLRDFLLCFENAAISLCSSELSPALAEWRRGPVMDGGVFYSAVYTC